MAGVPLFPHGAIIVHIYDCYSSRILWQPNGRVQHLNRCCLDSLVRGSGDYDLVWFKDLVCDLSSPRFWPLVVKTPDLYGA